MDCCNWKQETGSCGGPCPADPVAWRARGKEARVQGDRRSPGLPPSSPSSSLPCCSWDLCGPRFPLPASVKSHRPVALTTQGILYSRDNMFKLYLKVKVSLKRTVFKGNRKRGNIVLSGPTCGGHREAGLSSEEHPHRNTVQTLSWGCPDAWAAQGPSDEPRAGGNAGARRGRS